MEVVLAGIILAALAGILAGLWLGRRRLDVNVRPFTAPEVWGLDSGDEYVVVGTKSAEAARAAVIAHAENVEKVDGEDLEHLRESLTVDEAFYVMLDDERLRWVKGDEPGAVACFRATV
jgi:hypothetical protein